MEQNTPEQLPPPQTTVVTDSKSSDSKSAIWVVLGLLIAVLLIGGGIYIFMTSQDKNQSAAQILNQQQIETQFTDLNSELDTMDMGNVDSDLQEVDQELQKL